MDFQDRTPIFVVGVPRSGNQWLCRLLGDVLDSPVASGLQFGSNADEGHDRRGQYVIRLRHAEQITPSELLGQLSVRISRDPRDVVLSTREYYDSDWPTAIGRAKKHYERMDYVRGIKVETRFESLLAYTQWELGRILYYFEMDTDWDAIHVAVERQSYETRKRTLSEDMPYGKKHQLKAIGQGRAGRWKEEMPVSVREGVNGALWPWINGLGYEGNPDWWKDEVALR